MKIIKFTTLILFIVLSFFLLNFRIKICEAKSDVKFEQFHAKFVDKSSENSEDMDLEDDNNRRYRILVSAIKETLISKYERLDDQGAKGDYLIFFESYGMID